MTTNNEHNDKQQKINQGPKQLEQQVTSTAQSESRDTDKHKWLKARVQQDLQGISKRDKSFWLKQK